MCLALGKVSTLGMLFSGNLGHVQPPGHKQSKQTHCRYDIIGNLKVGPQALLDQQSGVCLEANQITANAQ